MRLHALLFLIVALGCASETPVEPGPASKQPPKPRRHTWDDDEVRSIDFPEPMTDAPRGSSAPGPAKPREPVRPNVKLALAVYDVISWDDVKIRDSVRGSPVKGLVSLTDWLKKARKAARVEALVASGREAQLDVEEPLRTLVGGTAAFRVAVLDVNEKGELELAVTPCVALADPAVAPATRVRVTPGEAVVVGGHRSEEGDSPRVDRLVLIEASATR